MTTAAVAARRDGPRIRLLASIAFFGVLPAIALALMFYDAVRVDGVAFDFRVFYLASEAVLGPGSLYPQADDQVLVDGRAYVYPPLTAVVAVPLTWLPMELAGLLTMIALIGAVLLVPYLLGVRDWRCYGLVLLWPPVVSAIQTGNVSIPLALLAALTWRFRDSLRGSGLALGLALAVKLVLWPVAVWLAATRRVATVALAVVSGAFLVLASWAVVAFDGFAAYPRLLRRLSAVMDDRGYTFYSLPLELGAPAPAARAIWLAVAFAALAGVGVLARRGDERSAFLVAVAASLALSPIVWLHYFALLVVMVALAAPRLGPLWFVPLGLVVTPGSGDPTPFQTTATVTVASVTVLLALAVSMGRRLPARARAARPVAAA